MNAITIEKLSERTLARLEERARLNRKSVNEEAADIIESIVGAEKMDANERLRFIDEIAAKSPKGVVQDDSTLFIRAERDRMR